jgi:hypothetical protein
MRFNSSGGDLISFDEAVPVSFTGRSSFRSISLMRSSQQKKENATGVVSKGRG